MLKKIDVCLTCLLKEECSIKPINKMPKSTSCSEYKKEKRFVKKQLIKPIGNIKKEVQKIPNEFRNVDKEVLIFLYKWDQKHPNQFIRSVEVGRALRPMTYPTAWSSPILLILVRKNCVIRNEKRKYRINSQGRRYAKRYIKQIAEYENINIKKDTATTSKAVSYQQLSFFDILGKKYTL